MVTIMKFRDGKIEHEKHYYASTVVDVIQHTLADQFEVPKWRSQWVERVK